MGLETVWGCLVGLLKCMGGITVAPQAFAENGDVEKAQEYLKTMSGDLVAAVLNIPQREQSISEHSSGKMLEMMMFAYVCTFSMFESRDWHANEFVKGMHGNAISKA